MLAILLGPKARNFLKKADKKLRERILAKMRTLGDDPMPHGSLKLWGEKTVYRIRVGDHRILYEIRNDKHAILIAKIDKRARVYD